MKLNFTKMHGAGNDFVVLDATRTPLDLSRAQLKHLGDRRLGVGADQILVVESTTTPGIHFRYRIFNGASGDEVEHCGNGARCFLHYVREHGLTTHSTVRVETVNNVLELVMQDDGRVTVDMNKPVFEPARIPFDSSHLSARVVGDTDLWTLDGEWPGDVAVVSMGNPHAVHLVDDVDRTDVSTIGPIIERHPRFARGVNAGFMQVVSREAIRLRVWERHAGETLACGTGACAAVVVGIRMGLLDTKVNVDTRGGMLTVEWHEAPAQAATNNHKASMGSVMMTGPAETVYDGEISL